MIARIILFSALTSLAAHAEVGKIDPAKAKQTAEQVCAACHLADGNSTNPQYPKLAGQHQEYLLKQLRNFKSVAGKPVERNNAVMLGMATPLTDDDMKGLAVYFSQQKLKPDAAKNKETLMLGQKLWRAGDASKGLPACAGCHGPNGLGIPAQYPRLQGQFAEYVEAQLKSFRLGERANDPNGMMRAVASRMTDAEIKAVADYTAGLR
ncbi:MAG: cytochrome c4 [Uliginosibacterium sp.]|nr:cytochrome c4 [Uliginosibacterium sp.]